MNDKIKTNLHPDFIRKATAKRQGIAKISWDDLAIDYGYSTGESARCAFKRYRKLIEAVNELEVNIVENAEKIGNDLKSIKNGFGEEEVETPKQSAEKKMKDYSSINTIIRTKEVKPRLVISDVHLPFAIDGWLEFVQHIHSKNDCHEEIIVNGDLIDNHQMSFHISETDSLSAIEEYELTLKEIKKLTDAFPNALMTTGNHDIIVMRKNREIGIDQRFLKDFNEMYNLPNTWKLSEYFIVNDVFYKHIGCCGGKMGHLNSAISNRMSTVSSHLHANGGVQYVTSPNGETIFGLNTGALCDDDKYAFRYGNNARFRATLGCGFVVSSKEAYFIPFEKVK